jgi:hypothetical protein
VADFEMVMKAPAGATMFRIVPVAATPETVSVYVSSVSTVASLIAATDTVKEATPAGTVIVFVTEL